MKRFQKLSILLCSLFLLQSWAMAENLGTITGKVEDVTGLPIAYASVDLLDAEGNIVDGTLTDGDGVFALQNEAFGTYTLQITVPGLKPYTKEVVIDTETTDMGVIVLASEVTELEGITARGEVSKFTTEIDKRVVVVGKDLVSAGATAAEVLNNIPSLSVDQQSGDLTLRGNNNVRVFVDGKPTNIPVSQLLRQLPSNSIDKVEIITNPSAKYDPDGNSGIINIVTNKNKRKGYNVTTDLGFTKANREKYNGGISANLNTGKFNFFGNYNTNFGQNFFRGQVDNFDQDLRQNLRLPSDFESHLFKIGFDWFINDKTALTIYTNQNLFNNEARNTSYVLNQGVTVRDANVTNSDNTNADYSLNFKRDFEKDGHSLEIDGFYSDGSGNEVSEFNWQSAGFDVNGNNLGLYTQTNDSGRDQTRIRVDYTLPFMEKGKIEAGVQYLNEGSDNEFFTNQLALDPNDDVIAFPDVNFDYTRIINSAYVNVRYQIKKFGVQLGLRAETVEEEAITRQFAGSSPDEVIPFNNDYNELYPSAFFTYDLTESDQISLSYSRRIDRPGIQQVTPIRQWQTATVRSEGNQDLLPQFTNSYEMGYLKKLGKKGNINANVFYRKIKDNISRYLTIDPDNDDITLLRFTNVEDNEAYGVELSSYYKPFTWWSFNASWDLFNNTLIGPDGNNVNQNLEVENTVWNARLSNDFKLTQTLNLQLFSMYRGRNKFLQGEMQEMFRLDIGARKSFAQGKGNITARLTDVFNTFYARADVNNPQNQLGEFRWESRAIFVGLNYSFGGKVKTRASKQQNSSGGNSGGGIGF